MFNLIRVENLYKQTDRKGKNQYKKSLISIVNQHERRYESTQTNII